MKKQPEKKIMNNWWQWRRKYFKKNIYSGWGWGDWEQVTLTESNTRDWQRIMNAAAAAPYKGEQKK